ncbi:MAG TPA: dienelactone hydrolase family protein [Streptomyces sp.]
MPSTVLQIPTPDGQADALAAFPDDGARHPGVLMYMDIFGLRPELERKARELAEHGYYVLVPNVFYRDGQAPLIGLPEHVDAEARPKAVAELLPLLRAHTPERAMSDAEAYLAFLTSRPEVSAGPVGTLGYCMGGFLALRAAAAFPDQIAAVASFHAGNMVSDAPDSPHRTLLPTITAAMHLGHAETDMTPEGVSELNKVLDGAGVEYTSEIYPGTVHGFTMTDTAAYSASGLQLHWERLVPLLGSALTTPR